MRHVAVILGTLAFIGACWLAIFVGGVGAQTLPPGMILIDCPIRPAPWQAPALAGHAGFDLNLDPSSAVSIARGVPAQCIAYPGGDERTYQRIIGLRVYIPRHGTDPGSTTGAMAQAVAIRDNSSGTWNSTEAEFWATGQNWRDYVSQDGRWVYSVRGGLDTQACDVPARYDWRRWPAMVQERDLIGCLDRIWARGGTLGMPVTPTVVSNGTANQTQTAVPTPAITPTLAAITALPTVVPTATVNPVEARLSELERAQREDRDLLRQMLELLTGGPP